MKDNAIQIVSYISLVVGTTGVAYYTTKFLKYIDSK